MRNADDDILYHTVPFSSWKCHTHPLGNMYMQMNTYQLTLYVLFLCMNNVWFQDKIKPLLFRDTYCSIGQYSWLGMVFMLHNSSWFGLIIRTKIKFFFFTRSKVSLAEIGRLPIYVIYGLLTTLLRKCSFDYWWLLLDGMKISAASLLSKNEKKTSTLFVDWSLN